jgi:hypothetical protein
VGVTTTSSRITGSVYDDMDQSGTLTGGDVGLGGVTIELFSDPNADGNPADGSLLRLTATDPSGYYELLNLSTALTWSWRQTCPVMPAVRRRTTASR